MRHSHFVERLPVVAGVMLLAAVLAGCQRSAGDSAPATPDVAQETVVAKSGAGPALPAEVAAEPATTGIATTIEASADAGPELSSMMPARAVAKLGVPVDLRYSFDGDVQTGRSVTLHLAAVPQVDGGNLILGLKEQPGIQAGPAQLNVKTANAGGVYREQLSVTQLERGPAELRVFVKMDLPEGSAHGWYSVPLGSAASAGKRLQQEQR